MLNWYAPKAWMTHSAILLAAAFAIGQTIKDRPAGLVTSILVGSVGVECATHRRSAKKPLTVSTGARLLDRLVLAMVKQWHDRARPVGPQGCRAY